MSDIFKNPKFIEFLNRIPEKDRKEFKKIDIDDDFYNIYKFYGETYAFLSKTGNKVGMFYFIPGSDKGALIDTGRGGGDIRGLIEKIYEGPVIVLYTHEHFDHTGGCNIYEDEYIINIPETVERMKKGYKKSEMGRGEGSDDYALLPCNIKTFTDGEQIDLGNRKLKAVYTPGHTMGCTTFVDEEHNIAFAGDTINNGMIFDHFNDDVLMHSDTDLHFKSIKKLMKYKKIAYLYFCHGSAAETYDFLAELHRYYEKIISGEAAFEVSANPVGKGNVKLYKFDRVNISTLL